MKYVVLEKTYRAIKEDYCRLTIEAYPYQKPEMLKNYNYSLINLVKTHSRIRYFVVYLGNEIILIAPMKIHKECVKVLGTEEGYNMSDFAYATKDSDILKEAIFHLFVYLKDRFFKNKKMTIDWWYLYEDSLSWEAIKKLKDEGRIDFLCLWVTKNVQIPLANSYDEYNKRLSKHARQNIRTAYNRANRDGYELSFHSYRMLDGGSVKKEARKAFKSYTALYIKRLKERYNRSGMRFFVKKTLMKYFGSGWKSASSSMSLLVDISINGEIAAYAKCYFDLVHKKITVPNLAIDIKWGFYSPGIVLVNELIKYVIEMGGVEYLSMGRGEEPYKYEMGGEQYNTYNMGILLPDQERSDTA